LRGNAILSKKEVLSVDLSLVVGDMLLVLGIPSDMIHEVDSVCFFNRFLGYNILDGNCTAFYEALTA
jgi:hypothetical protein